MYMHMYLAQQSYVRHMHVSVDSGQDVEDRTPD